MCFVFSICYCVYSRVDMVLYDALRTHTLPPCLRSIFVVLVCSVVFVVCRLVNLVLRGVFLLLAIFFPLLFAVGVFMPLLKCACWFMSFLSAKYLYLYDFFLDSGRPCLFHRPTLPS